MGGSQSGRKQENEEPKQVDLNDAKKEYLNSTVAIYVLVKIRVKRIKELDTNFKGFRAYWQEEIKKAIDNLGEVKVVNMIT